MADYKVVPFAANITRNDTTNTVASQMQQIIDAHSRDGWNYMHTDSVQTYVAGTSGCFGIGGQPGFNTTYNVMVFEK